MEFAINADICVLDAASIGGVDDDADCSCGGRDTTVTAWEAHVADVANANWGGAVH